MPTLRRVTIILKPFKSELLVRALKEKTSATDITVFECQGYGRQKGHLELYSGPEYSISFVPKVAVEFTISRFELDAALELLLPIARTGRIGDGKVFVREVIRSIDLGAPS